MAVSLIKKNYCPTCGKVAVEKSRVKFSITKLINLTCGHMVTEGSLSTSDYSSIVSSDNRKLMEYQIEGVKFVEESNARCLIADEMGLGKTIQALGSLKLHFESLTPTLIITKTTLKLQWLYEVMRWTGTKKVQAISSTKEFAIPGFDVYIMTYDILKDESLLNMVEIKSLILDECQAIKNHEGGRAKAVQKVVSAHNIQHIIGLSGTPIKNNAGEYFTILNLLYPSRFPTKQGFLNRYCDTYDNGFYGPKVGGLRDPEFFHQQTKDFIIRRTKDEVLKDLPELTRSFHHVELNKSTAKAYAEASTELEALFYADENEDTFTNMLAVINKMRQITGVSKVTECVDYVTDFLLNSNKPIVIFVHHHVVRDLLIRELNKWLTDGGFKVCLEINSSMNGEARAFAAKQFASGEYRVMVASTLAAGEGLNMQFCSDAIMLERQWNPANEEQAEARFHRFGQKNAVNVTYMIASETIDDYFTDLVEQKRAIVASALDGKVMDWESNSLLKELINITVAKGAKRFKLS